MSKLYPKEDVKRLLREHVECTRDLPGEQTDLCISHRMDYMARQQRREAFRSQADRELPALARSYLEVLRRERRLLEALETVRRMHWITGYSMGSTGAGTLKQFLDAVVDMKDEALCGTHPRQVLTDRCPHCGGELTTPEKAAQGRAGLWCNCGRGKHSHCLLCAQPVAECQCPSHKDPK